MRRCHYAARLVLETRGSEKRATSSPGANSTLRAMSWSRRSTATAMALQRRHNQGPACAMAAGAATIYRNYFAPVDGEIGQTRDRQIDALAGVGTALDRGAC